MEILELTITLLNVKDALPTPLMDKDSESNIVIVYNEDRTAVCHAHYNHDNAEWRSQHDIGFDIVWWGYFPLG